MLQYKTDTAEPSSTRDRSKAGLPPLTASPLKREGISISVYAEVSEDSVVKAIEHLAHLPRLKYFEESWVAKATGCIVPFAIGTACAARFEQLTGALRRRRLLLAGDDILIGELRRMFVAGGIGGFLSSRFVNPEGDLPFHLAHAEFVAAWSSVLIAADTAMDRHGLSPDASIDLLSRAARCMFGGASVARSEGLPEVFRRRYPNTDGRNSKVSIETYPSSDLYSLENLCIAMAQSIGCCLETIANYHATYGSADRFRDSLSQFGQSCAQLASGQMSSLHQTVLDDAHDWGWYRDVLDRKTLGVMLAPLAAFTTCDGSGRSELLRRCILILNDVFFHRGALDDLRDVEDDTDRGIAGVTAYMMISQGRVADVLLRESMVTANSAVLNEVIRSSLLRAPSWAWAQCREILGTTVEDPRALDLGGLGLSSATALVTYALANRPADLALSLKELASRRQSSAAMLMEAWQHVRRQDVLDLLVTSGTAFRVFDTIGDIRVTTETESRLSALGDERLKDVFGVFYRRTVKSYHKTLLSWNRLFDQSRYGPDVAVGFRENA